MFILIDEFANEEENSVLYRSPLRDDFDADPLIFSQISENEVAIEELEFVGRAWYLETLAGMAGNAVGALAGAAGINLSF